MKQDDWLKAVCCLEEVWQPEEAHERCAVMSAALTVVTPCVNYLLIYVARMGIDGAALANNVEAALYCAMLLTYVIVKERGLVKSGRHTWHGLCAAPRQALHGCHADGAAPVHPALLWLLQARQPPMPIALDPASRKAYLTRACIALAANYTTAHVSSTCKLTKRAHCCKKLLGHMPSAWHSMSGALGAGPGVRSRAGASTWQSLCRRCP